MPQWPPNHAASIHVSAALGDSSPSLSPDSSTALRRRPVANPKKLGTEDCKASAEARSLLARMRAEAEDFAKSKALGREKKKAEEEEAAARIPGNQYPPEW
jgi:hypothetical protein